MHYHFVVNPAAGRRLALPLVEGISAALREHGAEVSRYVTQAAGDAASHLRDLAVDHADRIVVVGGDGTLREVVNARPAPLPWTVGIVPMGTANLVGRETRMPLNHRAARIARDLLDGEPWVVDLLRLRHGDGTTEHAVANVGVGLDAEVVHAVARVRQGGMGGYTRWVGPIWDTLRTFTFPRLRVTIDGRITYAAAAVVVQNAHNYGGVFELSPDAALDSGSLDVMMIRARTHRDLFRILFGAWTRRVGRFHDVKIVRGATVRLRSATHARVQADGDPAGHTDLEIDLVPRGLTLLRAPA